jgi:hypothetical protein
LRAYSYGYYYPCYSYTGGDPDFGTVYGHAARTGYLYIGCKHFYIGSGDFNHSTTHCTTHNTAHSTTHCTAYGLPADVYGRAVLQHLLRKHKVPGVQGYHLRVL